MVCIYQIRDITNGKCYIGSTNNFKRRMYSHKSLLRLNKHHSPKLQRAWNKRGIEAFEFLILEICPHKEALISREQYYIDTLKPFYNCNQFAERKNNFKHTPEAIEKMRVSIEKARAEGRFMNEQHRKNFSGKGRDYSNNHTNGIAVSQYNLKGELLKEYPSARVAAIDNNIKDSTHVTACCKGKKKQTHGFMFKYKIINNEQSVIHT